VGLILALAAAQDVQGVSHTFTVLEENDFFAHVSASDRHYTQGLRLEYHFHDPRVGPLFTLEAIYGDGLLYSNGVAVGQSMYTPEIITADPPDPLDRPYAAWLYAAFMTTVTDAARSWQDTWEWSIGTVGPRALGDEIQSGWHELIGAQNPTWAVQLPNEIAGGLAWKRQWTHEAFGESTSPWCARTVTSVGLAAGTVTSEVAAGMKILWGWRAPVDFEAGRGPRGFSDGNGFRLYGFAGVEGRFVPWNIFLDGTVFRESVSVDRKYLTADFHAGVVLRLGPSFGVSYAQVFRTGELSNDARYHNFGSIALSLSFGF
jgi:hypothetical protein